MNATDLTGLGAVADLATTAIRAIWPDKTAQEQAQLAAAVALVNGQLSINQTEAASSDPLQHWRGGLGWVCVAGYFWNFVGQPLALMGAAIAGQKLQLSPLEIGPLVTLTLGMLGLGGLHVAERVGGTKP